MSTLKLQFRKVKLPIQGAGLLSVGPGFRLSSPCLWNPSLWSLGYYRCQRRLGVRGSHQPLFPSMALHIIPKEHVG